MRTYKLTKAMTKDMEILLSTVGAVMHLPDGEGRKRAFPSYVFVSKNDYKKLTQEVTKSFRKEYPYISPRKLKSSVGMHLLNLGPVVVNGIKDGFVLVDNNAIASEKKAILVRVANA